MSDDAKYANDAVEQVLNRAMAAASTPAQEVWRRASDRQLQARGRSVYDTPLIPGFEETRGEDVLMLPSEDEYDAQVSRGELPHYVQGQEMMERKGDAARLRRVVNFLTKVSVTVAPEGPDIAVQWYSSETNPKGRDYSMDRDRDNRTGIDIAWHGNENQDRDSTMEEPPRMNSTLRGGPT